MPFSVKLIEEIDRLQPDLKGVMFELLREIERQREESITRKIFEEFARKTEENFDRVWKAIGELAEAQKRTEQRVEELAEAQRRTEEELKQLAGEHRKTREMLGGLSDTVGYGLEDRAIKTLPTLLKQRYGIQTVTPLVRKFVRYNGRKDELNIFGTGKMDDTEVFIVGEAKARPSKKHIERFLKLIGRLDDAGIISKKRFLFVIGYSIEPEVEEYARERGVEVLWSYEV